jgi:hypothetical protein
MVEPGSELRASLVRVENGMPALTVDGACSYWVGGGWSEDPLSRDRPFRTGRLSDADVGALERSLPLGDVGALGDCPPPQPGDYDYGVRVIRTASTEAVCKTTGTRFDAAWTTLQGLAAALWESGTPMDGALHVSAVDAPSSASTVPAPYAWPTALPLTSFILPDAVQFQTGVSVLVDDPVAAGQLRALRDQYLSDRTAQPGLYTSWDGLEVTDQSVTALVYMRDAIPYEDAQGLLTF